MRQVVVLAFVLAALLAATASEASANNCNAYSPPISYGELPLGCPLIVYNPDDKLPPVVQVEHAGQSRAIDAQLTVETVVLSVWFETIDANCVESSGYSRLPYDRYSIDLTGVEVGDRVFLENGSVTITPAGACPTIAEPNLICQDPIQEYWACEQTDDVPIDEDPHAGHDHGAGCSAGGGLGFALAGLLAGLRRRRVTSRR